MNSIEYVFSAISAASWNSWWFPGFGELLNMLSFVFWWEVAFVIASIPAFIAIFIIGAWMSSL